MVSIRKCLDLCRKSYFEETLARREVEVYMEQTKDTVYLAFRGTEASKLFSDSGWVDVIRDLRTIPWYDKRVGWSHAGFLKGARAVVETIIKDYGLDKIKKLVITGHSLGGALAVNAAALFYSEGYTVHKVITFGAPRTFKKGTASKWNKLLDVDNFSNHGDPVCSVPLSFLGWRHVNEVKTKSLTDSDYNWLNHRLPAYYDAFEVTKKS